MSRSKSGIINTMNTYDVKKYTDTELFELMDLSNPTDRELEARIIQLIRKYSTIHNEAGRIIMKFFQDVYDHFFDEEEDDPQDEHDGSEESDNYDDHEQDQNQTQTKNAGKEGFANINTVSAAVEKSRESQTTTSTTTNNPIMKKEEPTEPPRENVLVNQLDYTRDKLNPLLKQTIKRVISIDSQYRDTKYPLSTEFTFNLSEPLKDVVSMRLYSIQIPVTWYTISNNYGGNFFILKGNAPGILDNPDFEYKIEIASGNYTAENLALAVNESIQALKSIYTDISFGDMQFTYNSNNSLGTMKIDIKNVFNENKYMFEFADWSSPIATNESGTALRYLGNTTLPAFLGFNSQSYLLDGIQSEQNLPLTANSQNDDNNFAVYVLDNSNNYFDIAQYQGPAEYNQNTPILNNIRIQLNLNGTYSRNAIVNEINSKLQENIYLENSGITRIDITDPNIDNFGRSYYRMNIRLKKRNTLSGDSLKTVIIFPQETNSTTRVWTLTGAPQSAICALLFRNIYNELSNIIAETESLQTNYIVKSKPYIVYKCITPGYTNPYNVRNYSTVNDICFNDYKIELGVSPDIGWSFSEYLQEINTAYSQTNTKTINLDNPNGIFNMTNTGIFNDPALSKIYFRTDINRVFLKDNYTMDLSNSYLFTTLNIGANINPTGDNFDLSENNILTSTILALPNYTVDTSYIAVISPKSNYSTNVNAPPWYITPVAQLAQPNNLQQFVSYVNASFQSFQDLSGSNPLSECNLSAIFNQDGTVSFILTIRITKTLTENDYQIQFYDLSASSGTINLASNYWQFTSFNGLVSYPTIGIKNMTGTLTTSYAEFTRDGYGRSASNVGSPLGTTYGFSTNSPVISTNENWTINFWYYSTLSTSALTQVLFSQYSQDGDGKLLFMVSNNNIQLDISEFTVVGSPFTETIQNGWHMYSVVRNGDVYSIYFDGELVKSEISPTTYIIEQTVFSLGIHGNARGYWDDVAYWPYALTSIEIADVFSPFIWQNTVNNSWFNNLKVGDQSYNLIDYKIESSSYSDIYGISVISGFTYIITEDTSFVLLGTVPGIRDEASSVIINIPASTNPNNEYTRQQLFNIINAALTANPISNGSFITTESYNQKEYVKFRMNLNQIYTAKDYRVVFYDPFSFVRCYVGIKSVRNASWDTTLGWILGFRLNTEYVLSEYGETNPITIVGDTAVTTNLYNYFLIVLDDYTQSRLNDGLVTVTNQENDIVLPSYADRTKIICDVSGELVFNDPELTQKQIYAANEIIQAKKNKQRYTASPVVQDIFALIPLKAGIPNGSLYTEFGGTLQNQERTYFGPVNIQRMTIRLLNDRGDIVDLNGSNWSFSLICEQLYQQKSI